MRSNESPKTWARIRANWSDPLRERNGQEQTRFGEAAMPGEEENVAFGFDDRPAADAADFGIELLARESHGS